MLNNINNHDFGRSKKTSVSVFPGFTSEDVFDEIEDSLKIYADTLAVHARTNDKTMKTQYSERSKRTC